MAGGPSSLKRSKASRARIKKIMQMDEDVGKLASATPVMISKSLECFMQLILDEAAKEARSRGSKKLTAHHLKHTINNTPSFDFLLDVASRIPDPIGGESGGVGGESGTGVAGPSSRRKPSSAAYNAPASGSGSGPAQQTPVSRGRKRKTGTGEVERSQAQSGAEGPPPTYPYNIASGSTSSPIVSKSNPTGSARSPGLKEEDNNYDDDDDDDDNYGGTRMTHQPVRPGLGNLLNPSNGDEGDRKSTGGAGGAVKEEGGRGMFDDYDDDDDY